MCDLQLKKILVLAAALVFYIQSFAQIKGTYNYLDFANKPYYFGMTLAYNSSQLKVVHGRQFILNDSIYSVESARGPGFNLGGIFNLKVGRYFDFRLSPTFSFANRSLTYKVIESPEQPVINRIDPVFIEAPFHIRYKSEPYKDIRLFVIGGIKYSVDLASNSQTRQAPTILKVSPSEFAVEYGAGIQIFFPYFIFSPEFKVSHGLSNLLISNDELIYSSVLDKLMSRTFTLSFHFEG